jgi:hypothetical protein
MKSSLVCQKASEEQHGLARERDAHVLRHRPKEDYPQAVAREEVRQDLEDCIGHDFRDYARCWALATEDFAGGSFGTQVAA